MKKPYALLIAAFVAVVAFAFAIWDKPPANRGSTAAAAGPATSAAMLALAEGVDLANGPDYAPERGADTEEQALLAKLQSGDAAAALEAIRGLAARGGDSLRWLEEIMNDEGWPDEVRSAAARELLTRGSEDQAAKAIAALGNIAGGKNTELLGDVLLDENLSDRLRLEAAYALGQVKSPLAADLLYQGYEASKDDLFRQEELVAIMGSFPFPAVREEFQQLLYKPQAYPEIRATAAEALGDSSGEAIAFLMDVAKNDADASVREMAAWAAYYNSGTGQLGPKLAEMAMTEPEADVRRRLYEAQLFQDKNEASKLLDLVRSEKDTQARVAGLLAVADSVGRGAASVEASQFFRDRAVPELEKAATGPNSLNVQLRAVMALQRAQTPQARQALARIATTSSHIVAAAASGNVPQQVQR